jgi:2',3'-cyclic-nucleotide 2'-phosphodiesterase (5'-nucleotidase family)
MSGITMQIKDRKAINVQVGGKPLDLTKTYTIINSDYVASGGDNAAMLKNLPQESNGYLMRDAIFDYIKMLQAEGKKINANIENRVTNVE